MIILNLTTIIAVLIGGALTVLGVWSAAVADRIRGRRADARAARAAAVDPPAPAIRPRRAPRPRVRAHAAPSAPPPMPKHRPLRASRETDIRDWLVSMGYDLPTSAEAARRAVLDCPQGAFEQQVRAAMPYLPVEN